MRKNLLDALKTRPLVCDGAMGTQLFARGLVAGECGERWNLERPADVEAIHRAYRSAGCDLVTTNTFGASTPSLQRHGLDAQIEPLNRAGAQLARKGAGDDAWVLGDIGPFGGFLEPVGEMKEEELLLIFQQQAAALKDGGADGTIIETMADPAEVAVAVHAAKSVGTWPAVATYAFERGDGKVFRTMMGTTAADAVKATVAAGADVVGANCGTSLGLDDYLRLAEQLVSAAGTTPVIIQPNAGFPQMNDGKLVYAATPADLANLARKLLGAGVRIVGGCCGTTPEHLRAIAAAVKGK